jgi:hypothetical protein
VFMGRDCRAAGRDGGRGQIERSGGGEGRGRGRVKSSSLVRHVNPWCDRYSGNDVRRGCAHRDRGTNDGAERGGGRAGGRGAVVGSPGRACFSTKRRRRFFIIAFLI